MTVKKCLLKRFSFISSSSNSAFISSGGQIIDSLITYGGQIFIRGGFGSNMTVSGGARYGFGGDLIVESGGIAEKIYVDYEGDLSIGQNGNVQDTTVKYLGHMYVNRGGSASSTVIESSGLLAISSATPSA